MSATPGTAELGPGLERALAGEPREATAKTATDDAWPNTNRPMPWVLAAFLVMVWIVPFDAITLPVSLPVGAKLDRFALAGVVLVWIAWMATVKPPRRKPTLMTFAVGAYACVALFSIVAAGTRIVQIDQLAISQKQLAVLFSYMTIFVIAASTLRPAELRPFGRMFVGFGVITALGTIWEFRTGYNVFFDLAAKSFGHIASVDAPTTVANPTFSEGRATIVGPTTHGLAVTTMLALAMPFALVEALESPTRRRKLMYMLAVGILLGGALSTQRKSAVIEPIVAVMVLACYRPRPMLKLAPFVVVLAAFIHVLAPSALGTLTQFSDLWSAQSTEGRTSDLPAIKPDIFTRPAIGHGYGTLNTDLKDHYRILDDEFLDQIWEVGLIGLIAYIFMVLASLVVAHPIIRSGDPVRGPPVLAAAAGCTSFLVAGWLFDILSFPEDPYLFFFIAAMITVAASSRHAEAKAAAARRVN